LKTTADSSGSSEKQSEKRKTEKLFV